MAYDGGHGGRTGPPPAIELTVEMDRELIPRRTTEIEAHLKVDVSRLRAPGALSGARTAVVIAVDIAETHRATVREALPALLRELPEGVFFVLLGGGPEPVPWYPREGAAWACATPGELDRAAFASGVLPLHREGERPAGYAAWVAAARTLLTARDADVRHLVLITDGSGARGGRDGEGDQHAGARLVAELDACAGCFSGDVFALGTGWDPDPLLRITERLHGRPRFVDGDLAGAVTDAVRTVRQDGTPPLRIEVTVRPTVTEVSLKEVSPGQHRLVREPLPGAPRRWVFPVRRWEKDVHDYLLTLTVRDADTDPLKVPLQFAMVSVGGVHEAVVALWLPPGASPGALSDVWQLTETEHLHEALTRGLTAVRNNDPDSALRLLTEAARLAADHETQRSYVLSAIQEVAEIEEGPDGLRVRRLKQGDTSDLGRVLLEVGSRGGQLPEPSANRPPRRCGHCGATAGNRARYCVTCGREL
ncbi:MAG TPA: hypothetical protein VFP69_18655 [Streptomyces sp.]|nr:hypothetical protein [Streptomyces sp.]